MWHVSKRWKIVVHIKANNRVFFLDEKLMSDVYIGVEQTQVAYYSRRHTYTNSWNQRVGFSKKNGNTEDM
jgi:hypothetical protein